MMGTKKVGALSSPRKKAFFIIRRRSQIAIHFPKYFFSPASNPKLSLDFIRKFSDTESRSYEPSKHHRELMKSDDVLGADEKFLSREVLHHGL